MELFDKVFEGAVRLTDAEKKDAVGGWLKREYDIRVKDSDVLVALLDLHEPGSENQHFGHPEVSSAFGKSVLQLARFADGWHVVFRQPHHSEHMILHPKSEASYSHPMNRKLVGDLRNLLKNSSMVSAEPAVQKIPEAAEQFVKEPTALIDGSNVHIIIPDEKPVDELDSVSFSSDASGLGSLLQGGSSISIDIDPSSSSDDSK